MIAIEIEALKHFTQDLFIGTAFDSFLIREAVITTCCTYRIDGRPSSSADETIIPNASDFIPWSYVKPVCFSMIKGNRLPEQFFISLLLPKSEIPAFIENKDTGLLPEQVQSLVINLKYAHKKVTCTTGTSLSVFTLDKTLEQCWDRYVQNLLLPYL